jgi:uncharacterized protein YlxW (UPF0749 family)
MSLREQLEEEVKEYNEFARSVQRLKEQHEAAEQERLIKFGGVQKLAEIVAKVEGDEDKPEK